MIFATLFNGYDMPINMINNCIVAHIVFSAIYNKYIIK